MITPELLAKPGKESHHQKALFCWAAQHSHRYLATSDWCMTHRCWCSECPVYPELEFLFAIPNGGLRSKITAARMKAEGVRKGVPDVMLPVPIGSDGQGYAGLFIEMKVGRNAPSDEQNKWHMFLARHAYRIELCYSWIEAVSAIERYLKG